MNSVPPQASPPHPLPRSTPIPWRRFVRRNGCESLRQVPEHCTGPVYWSRAICCINIRLCLERLSSPQARQTSHATSNPPTKKHSGRRVHNDEGANDKCLVHTKENLPLLSFSIRNIHRRNMQRLDQPVKFMQLFG